MFQDVKNEIYLLINSGDAKEGLGPRGGGLQPPCQGALAPRRGKLINSSGKTERKN